MATKNENPITPLDFMEVKRSLANEVGTPILQGKFFDLPNHEEIGKALRNLQEFVSAIVVEHDKLAEATGNIRLVGKRGRKPESTKKVETVDDVMARLSK